MKVSGELHGPAGLHPGDTAPGTHLTGGWVDPRAGMDVIFLPRCSHTWELVPLWGHRAEFPQFLDQGQSVGLLG
jgi:hypothetical protein